MYSARKKEKDVELFNILSDYRHSVGRTYPWQVAPQQSLLPFQFNNAKFKSANYIYNLFNFPATFNGKPKRIRGDNGPEMMSKWFRLWLNEREIEWSAIPKGSPQQNAIVERFNRTYREDILDANIFPSIQRAQNLTDEWIIEYNTVREHEALGYKTPASYAA